MAERLREVCARGGNTAQCSVCIPALEKEFLWWHSGHCSNKRMCGCLVQMLQPSSPLGSSCIFCQGVMPLCITLAKYPSPHPQQPPELSPGAGQPGIKCPGASGDEFWGVPAPVVASSLSSSNANPKNLFVLTARAGEHHQTPRRSSVVGSRLALWHLEPLLSWGWLSKLESQEIMLSYALLALKSSLHPL